MEAIEDVLLPKLWISSEHLRKHLKVLETV